MNRWLLIFLGLAALLLLAFICANMHQDGIQSDLGAKTRSALAESRLSEVDANFVGRELTLTGNVTSQAEKDRAAQVARRVYGINTIENAIRVVAPPEPQPALPEPGAEVVQTRPVEPYRLTIERNSVGVRLRGDVPDARTKLALIETASSIFGPRAVIDGLRPRDGAPNGFSEMAISGMEALKALQEGQVALNDLDLTMTGQASDAATGEAIANALRAASPAEWKSIIDINWPEPAQAALNCQAEFDALLAKGSSTAFQSAKAELSDDGRALLKGLAEVAATCPEAKLEIAGHTDSSGGEALNQTLSEQRAQAAVEHLVEQGLERSRMTAVGFGESRPIADNDTPDGRATNRRIEFTVQEI